MASTIKCDTIQSTTANVFFQNSSGTEYARFDSGGNLGIGTTTPGAKLDVRGSSTFLINAANPTAWVSSDSSLTTQSIYMQVNTTSSDTRLGSYTNHPLLFLTNNSERMRLYADGRLSVNGNSTYDAGTTVSIGGGSTNVRATSAQFAIARTTMSTQYEGINFNTGPSRACFIGRPPNSDDLIIGWDAGSALSEGLRFPSPGGGIKFPATQVSSADANTLDDYEEGTWTPVIKFAGNNVGVTYSNQTGTYVKIGKQVTAWFIVNLTSKGSSTGNATITGVPFSSTNYGHGPLDLNSGFTTQTQSGGYCIIAGTDIFLRYNSAAGYSDFNNTVFTNTSMILGVVTYYV